nr:hypothetical protein [Tanacetum cinerariifolium]
MEGANDICLLTIFSMYHGELVNLYFSGEI